MTAIEKGELALIPVVAIGFWLTAPALPVRLSIGGLLLAAAALLLLQSLVRDIVLLVKRRRGAPSGTLRTARCMCIESAIGATGVATGLALLGASLGHPFVMPRWAWGLLALAVAGFGFAIKDYVVAWSPWRIRRDQNHVNLVVYFKK